MMDPNRSQLHPQKGTGAPRIRVSAVSLLGIIWGAFLVVYAASGAVNDNKGLMENPEQIQTLLTEGKIEFKDVPNPHWNKDGCIACHLVAKAGDQQMPPLRNENINELCGNCHDPVVVAEYIHAVDMEPPEDFLDRMPEDFVKAVERQDNLVSCIVCHDMPLHCDENKFGYKELNPRFFRGGPYQQRTDLCFNCHDPSDYERYNPHDQITDEGELDTEQCFFCHNVTPNRAGARSIDDVTFNVAEDLRRLCTGCHPYKPHPGGAWFKPTGNLVGGGPNHLKVPPERIRKRLEKTVKEAGVVMPLEPGTGAVFCATCHNPHERGVQYYHKADIGADGYKRLRRGKMVICSVCHDI